MPRQLWSMIKLITKSKTSARGSELPCPLPAPAQGWQGGPAISPPHPIASDSGGCLCPCQYGHFAPPHPARAFGACCKNGLGCCQCHRQLWPGRGLQPVEQAVAGLLYPRKARTLGLSGPTTAEGHLGGIKPVPRCQEEALFPLPAWHRSSCPHCYPCWTQNRNGCVAKAE